MALDKVRVTATGAGVSYYPEFLARHLQYFADEDLIVETEAPGHGPWVARALDQGTADVALGGIWRPLMYRGRLSTYSVFAQLCARCPLVLVGREESDDFVWSDIEGRSVLIPDGAPSPLMVLLGVLKREGVEMGRYRLIQDFMAPEATDLFRGGLADYYLVAPVTSDVLVAEGVGHVVTTLAKSFGPNPWSVYYGRPDFLAHPANLAGRFARGIERALQWIQTHDPEEAPEVLEKYFPGVDVDLTAQSIRTLRALGVWDTTIEIGKQGLASWQEVIRNYGLTDRIFEYDEIIEVATAEWVRTNI